MRGGGAGATTHYTTLPGPARALAISLRRQNKGRRSPPHSKTRQAGTFIYTKGKGGVRRRGLEGSNGKAKFLDSAAVGCGPCC